ncbi:M28 family peptidase [Archangium lansingense]|uniref:M28 family peptidase n=1 Tax=Archangium lansingense TaxID=2995310 RepID=A0ABT3ZUC0_9BACT|nr:M28 family peptidase [Archangium lansinium]MCY1072987.1 M28 family peptidase [Archangium lansinium]
MAEVESEAVDTNPRASLRHPDSRAGWGVRGVWGLWGVLVVGVLGAVWSSERPPEPLGSEVPAEAFSEARAWPVLRHLVDEVGPRVAGTPGQARAAEYLVEQLRGIPGVEVELQRAAGVWVDGHEALDYRTENVLARLPGTRDGVVLVAAHYDSAEAEPGAGDNALAVAAAVEVMRALAAGPRPERTVVLGLNGAEEAGLVGAAGLLGHPWLGGVEAFINLDAAGSRGRSLLFQSTPSAPWLLAAYARSVPHPYALVVGQELFQSGLIPSDTDYRVFTSEAHWPGMDLALYQDGYAYHTPLDGLARVEPGSLRQLGENVLALVRELARGPRPEDAGEAVSTYYDVLGVGMVAYGRSTAWGLVVLGGVFALGALGVAWRRSGVAPASVARALGGLLVWGLFGVLVPVGAALLLGFVLGRPHGWYAAPWLAGAAFGALTLAGVLWGSAVVPGERTVLARGAAALVLAWAVGAALTAVGLGVAYLFPWWTLPGAVLLGVACLRERLAGPVLLVASVPGWVLTVELVWRLLAMFIPVTGRLAVGLPLDAVVALLVALAVLPGALGLGVALGGGGRPGRTAGAVALLAWWGVGRSPRCARPMRSSLGGWCSPIWRSRGLRRDWRW